MKPGEGGLRKEALWVGIGALLGAPLVFLLFADRLADRDALHIIEGDSLGLAQQTSRRVEFYLDQRAEPIRYSARLGRSSLLVQRLRESDGRRVTCLVDDRGYTWEIAIDGDLFVSFEYARARLQADRAVGWTFAGVLLASGIALLWMARQLPPTPRR